MAISHEDRQWFRETVDQALAQRDAHCEQIVEKALAKHNEKSIVHNPVKAIPILSAFALGWEALKSIFKH